MNEVPTVRIVHDTDPLGWCTINLSDFDPARHRRYDDALNDKLRERVETLQAEAPAPEPAGLSAAAVHDMTKAELHAALTARGIAFDPKATNRKLAALLLAAETAS